MSGSTVICQCGAINLKIPLELPTPSELCHCNPCRQTSGALFEGFVRFNGPPPSSVLQKCTAYPSSKDLHRYFCTTCGTKLFINAHRPGIQETWTALGGAVDPPEGTTNVLKVEVNEYVSDTMDGGLAAMMGKLGGREIPAYETAQSHGKLISPSELDQMTRSSDSLPPLPKDAVLTAECHCGGVSIRIKRADHGDKSIPCPDRYVPPDGSERYVGRACVCRDCRLHQGVSLATWMYVPYTQILNPHTGRPIAHRAAATTVEGRAANEGLNLSYYMSSVERGAYRAFCSTCGASVFYDFDDRPEVSNVAPGLVRAEEGIMARRWISWDWGATSWEEKYIDKEIRDAWMATAEKE